MAEKKSKSTFSRDNAPYAAILAFLEGEDSPRTIKDIAAAVGSFEKDGEVKTVVSAHMTTLVNQGLVEKTQLPDTICEVCGAKHKGLAGYLIVR